MSNECGPPGGQNDIPKILYVNPRSLRGKRRREGAYQIYARTHKYFGDASYVLVNGDIDVSDEDLFIEMRDAMQEFVDRCDNGEILSKYTYAKFKSILTEAG